MKSPAFIFSGNLLLAALVFCAVPGQAQQEDSVKEISLPTVVIKAFEQNKKLKEVPAGINYVGTETFKAFSASSIVAALNTTPGVRMEERSPGSYRINIRGSSLRSPFGVRNVKIYYNDIPFTGPGGDSYLNQLGYYNFGSVEIIKGSNNSLYGAGTGGVLLIESLKSNEIPGISAGCSLGSYHLQNYYASVTTESVKITSRALYQHQESDGYREHSRLKRDVVSWNGLFKIAPGKELKTTFLYGDLFYETPGALTKAEFNADPKRARPATAAFPGAVSADASVHQRMFLAGVSYQQPVVGKLQNKTTVYGMFTELRNPNINTYDKSAEPHAGGRTVFNFEAPLGNASLHIDAGGELQRSFTSVNIYKNVAGRADTLRSSDDINNNQSLLFLQAAMYSKDWTILASSSWSTLRVQFQRFSPASSGKQSRTFNNELGPRFAVMRKLRLLNIYTSIGKGFSPPATSELLPTGGAINIGLDPEKATNYDLGVKGDVLKNVYIDVDAFFFSLRNTIVQRRDAGGGNFFLNAGKTRQHGIETLINYRFLLSHRSVRKSLLWLNHTWHDFHYREFKQLANDFSGNRLPSVPRHAISAGMEIVMNNGLSAAVTHQYSGKIFLNDANSDFARAYHIAGLKVGYESNFNRKMLISISAGVENLFNTNYSLGNDINGFGGRYYNAAARRNFYFSAAFSLPAKTR